MIDETDPRNLLRAALIDGFDASGVIDGADVLTYIGNIGLEVVVEIADFSGRAQVGAYETMCDVLATRLSGAADQVFGVLTFSNEPDLDSLAMGLALMLPSGNTSFTPILPLSHDNTSRLAESKTSISYLIDDATSLIFIAADHAPPTRSRAETLLGQLDELVDRHCQPEA